MLYVGGKGNKKNLFQINRFCQKMALFFTLEVCGMERRKKKQERAVKTSSPQTYPQLFPWDIQAQADLWLQVFESRLRSSSLFAFRKRPIRSITKTSDSEPRVPTEKKKTKAKIPFSTMI